MQDSGPRVILDTSALVDLFGRWTGDYKQRRGDLVREVHILAPLRPYLFSTLSIRDEAHQLLVIGADLEKYVTFEVVSDEELRSCPGFVLNRTADYSLVALAKRLESHGFRTFVIAKDRTLLRDLARAGLRTELVVPTGFAEAVTVLTPEGGPSRVLASRVQNNTFENLSNSMRLERQTRGEAAYRDWQEFLNSRTAAKHDLIEALRATGVAL
jgi:hypothetical protein